MIENRDIHSYNCDVYINHNNNIYQVPILNGLEITFERKGVAGKCTFSIIGGGPEFEEGDSVKVRISKTWMFYGYIFTKSRSSDGVIKITCYDQLRYLKNKESIVFVNKSVGEIVKALANDRKLSLGAIRDSKYKIPSITKENATYFDIIMTAIEATTQATGEIFILYDRVGKLTLCPLKHMHRNVVIDSTVIGDFDYESTIDKQTYNMVRVGYKNSAGGITYQTWKDQKNIDRWGMLQLTEKADSSWNAVSIGAALLNMYNSKTRTLKIKNAMGAVEVVAGAVILVNLNLGDMTISNNMVVDAVTHRIEDGLYSMDLELIGGEFVSTRGVQTETNNSKRGEHGSETITTGAKDWGHGITAEMMNKVLKGPLAGKGELFVKLGNAFGVNPMLVAMIIRIESYPTMNSGLALKGNNFGGITWTNNKNNYAAQHYDKIWMGDRYYVKFPSVDKGIEYQFYLLGRTYINDWKKKSIHDIIMTYAPPYENDSAGYIRSLKNFYKQNTGTAWKESLLGEGVTSMEDGRNKMNQTTTTALSTQSGAYSSLDKAGSKAAKIGMGLLGKGIGASEFRGYGFHNYAWCADFVCYCQKKAGTYPFNQWISGCDYMYSEYKKKGKLLPAGSIPKPGDVIFFWSSGGSQSRAYSNHVGLVVECDGHTICSVEGNSGRKLVVTSNRYGLKGGPGNKIVGIGSNS